MIDKSHLAVGRIDDINAARVEVGGGQGRVERTPGNLLDVASLGQTQRQIVLNLQHRFRSRPIVVRRSRRGVCFGRANVQIGCGARTRRVHTRLAIAIVVTTVARSLSRKRRSGRLAACHAIELGTGTNRLIECEENAQALYSGSSDAGGGYGPTATFRREIVALEFALHRPVATST